MKKSKSLAVGLIVLLMACGLVLAGCGNGDDGGGNNNSGSNSNDNSGGNNGGNTDGNTGGNAGGNTEVPSYREVIEIMNLSSSDTISRVRIVDDNGKEILDQNTDIPPSRWDTQFFFVPVGSVTISIYMKPSNALKTKTFYITKGKVLMVTYSDYGDLIGTQRD